MKDFQKNKGNPRPTLRKEKLRIADHFNSLVKSYVGDEAQRKTIMSAFLAKKPKSYAQINYPLYRFNSITLSVLHLISFICAVSIVGYIQSLDIGATAHVLSLVAVLFLVICEFGQHALLNVAFENWHATNNVPNRIGMMCVFFSAVSILSSAYGTYHFATTYDLPTNTIITGMLVVSAVNEILILYTTLEIHKYQKTVFQESVLVNDMHFQNSHSLFFDGMPNVQRMATVLLDDKEAPTLPIGETGTAEIIVQPQQPYRRTRQGVTADSNSTKKVRKTSRNSKDVTSVTKEPVTPVTTPQKPVITKKVARSRKDFSYSDVNRNISIYSKRIETHKDGGTKQQHDNLRFFEWIKNSHDFSRGNYPYVEPMERANHIDNIKNLPS